MLVVLRRARSGDVARLGQLGPDLGSLRGLGRRGMELGGRLVELELANPHLNLFEWDSWRVI